eukprot:2049642-Pleurochrysis_carterae.AAC.2
MELQTSPGSVTPRPLCMADAATAQLQLNSALKLRPTSPLAFSIFVTTATAAKLSAKSRDSIMSEPLSVDQVAEVSSSMPALMCSAGRSFAKTSSGCQCDTSTRLPSSLNTPVLPPEFPDPQIDPLDDQQRTAQENRQV